MVGRARSVWTEQILMIFPLSPGGDHVPGRFPAHKEGAGEIGGNHTLPVLHIKVQHGNTVLDSGIVHQDVKRTHVLLHPGHSFSGGRGVGDVEGQVVDPSLRVVSSHGLPGCFQPFGIDAIEHHGAPASASPLARALPIPPA